MQTRRSFFTPYGPAPLVVDFLLNICAFLFAVTAYSSATFLLSITLATPAVLVLLLDRTTPVDTSVSPKKGGSKRKNVSAANDAADLRLVARPFLTHYRAAMMISTFLSILAVDFRIFPRRFAKVETWGVSLMDLGVGSFVFSAGVVSARVLFKTDKPGTRPNLLIRLLQAIRHSIPLFVLGVVRLISVKGLDYAEHVTEYGVHWNFFFTLGLLPPFVELSDTLVQVLFRNHKTMYPWLAILIALLYEVVLNNTSLLSYILVSPRGPSLLSKNREGVFSFIGYLAIFLAGRGTGTGVVVQIDRASLRLPEPSNIPERQVNNRERMLVLWSLAIDLGIYTLFFWLTTSVYTFNLNVSRRLANLPYVLWVCAFNNAQLLLFGLVEYYGPAFSYNKEDESNLRQASSKIMQVFNKNGLVIFLIANLMTGVVNLGVNTLDVGNLAAMCVLIGYAALITAVALGLDHAGIKIKL